jgi:hypothetical protein
MRRSLGPRALLTSAVKASLMQIDQEPFANEEGRGAVEFTETWGGRVAKSAAQEFFGTYVLASALKQDPRYIPCERAGFKPRLRHALRRVFITRTDSGGTAFNYSGLGGQALAVGLENAWTDRELRSASRTFRRLGYSIGWNAASNVFKEFVTHRNAPRQ